MKLQSIQVARFLAAFLVVYYHAAGFLLSENHRIGLTTSLADYGWAGVDLFFVISGVVISLTSRGLDWRKFIAKRSQRILPLYFGFALPSLVVYALHGDLGWRYVLATLALWPVTDQIVSPIVFGGWTLCFEALFYAATALVLWRRSAIFPLLALYVVALVHPTTPLLHYLGNPIILEFLAGVVIAHAPRPRWSIAAIPAGVLLLALLHPFAFQGDHSPANMLAGQDMAGRVLIAGLPCALIIWGALGVNLRSGPLTYLGDASYSIYLTQGPVLLALAKLCTRLPLIPADVVLIGSSAMVVLVGCRIYELFEKPALAFLRRIPAPAAVARVPS
jgi:exopolysaccharide production protein ExoZ